MDGRNSSVEVIIVPLERNKSNIYRNKDKILLQKESFYQWWLQNFP